MRILSLGSWVMASIVSLLAGTAALAGPSAIWEITDGLANPEIVLPSGDAGVLYVSNVNGNLGRCAGG